MRITEKKRVRIKDCNYDNPVFLCWKGVEGGWNYYLFDRSQTVGKQVSGEQFITAFTDLENQTTGKAFLFKESEQTITCGAENLDENDIRGIATMLDSVEVKLLLNPLSWRTVEMVGSPAAPTIVTNPLWETVRIMPGSFSLFKTSQKIHSVQFTFFRLGKNIQRQ